MKWFFDTSALIPVFLGDHIHHDRSAALFRSANRKTAGCSAHSLAEVYATLTRLPGKFRASSEQALFALEDIDAHLTPVSLEGGEYLNVIRSAAENGIVGVTIYDALLAACAMKANAMTIYTWDHRHFRLLGPEIASRIANP